MRDLRRRVLFAGFALGSGLCPIRAVAGAQREEQLADSVRSALSAAVRNDEPPQLEFASTEARLTHLSWLSEMSQRLRRRKPDYRSRTEFLNTVKYESLRARLDPTLVLGLIEVESGFRKFAVSTAGAQGYMQVMPFWARLIGDGTTNLFNLRANLRYGCVILEHYLMIERGNEFLALGRYNGSRGRPEYPNAVFAARKRWAYKPG